MLYKGQGSWHRGRLLRSSALILALALAGCGSMSDGPSAAERKAMLQAQNIYPTAYKAEILAYFRSYLNDPAGIRGAFVSEPALKQLPFGERYVACVRFNARKGADAYGGSKDRAAVFVSGKLDRVLEQSDEACTAAAFVPFPEMERLSR
jgi:hypothetical protein